LVSLIFISRSLIFSISHFFVLCVSELRRFAMFDSTALRPYIISAISCYKHFERLGYITLKDERLVLNDEKALSFLEFAQTLFESILDAEDEMNGQRLEQILNEMQEESLIVKWLVSKLFVSHSTN
jgi:hypothetical protein